MEKLEKETLLVMIHIPQEVSVIQTFSGTELISLLDFSNLPTSDFNIQKIYPYREGSRRADFSRQETLVGLDGYFSATLRGAQNVKENRFAILIAMETPDFNIKKEQTERNEQFEKLEQLDGFNNLSEKQKQMIRMSLYVQQRAVRGTDEASAENIELNEDGEANIDIKFSTREGGSSKYNSSQRHIYNWYCHAVVGSVEATKVIDPISYTNTPGVEGHVLTNKEDFDAFIELELNSRPLPAVLHLLDKGVFVHSALILGKAGSGDYIAWEKLGYGLPYRIVSLEEIYNDYSAMQNEWVIRDFRAAEEPEI